MIEQISERVFKNWKTTSIAVLTAGLISYLGFSESMPWETLYGWYAAAFTFLFSK
jgi:hypothetical protein